MPSNDAPNGSLTTALSTSSKDDLLRHLSRSPHPYHRRSSSLRTNQTTGKIQAKCSESSDSTESEERATEADDEKGPILKGLPAPPLRGRKGLKGSKTPADSTPAISPFPTPPALQDRHSSYFDDDRPRKGSRFGPSAQDRAVEAYRKYVKKRRAEVARRCTEAVLLALIGLVACRTTLNTRRLQILSQELWISACILSFLCLAHPVRVAFAKFQSGNTLAMAIKAGFHVPSVFDPGHILYPVFLPFFISTSLISPSLEVIVTNIVLGISSLPQEAIPFGGTFLSTHTHWLLSVTPILNGSFFTTSNSSSSMFTHQMDAEKMALLFPLHQCTLATIKYLTSTSLDPAEIQLLSAGLINLYLFARTPQTEILKALLWIGALCLFISCRQPLSWEVRLARIPSWKFARNKPPKTGLLSIFETFLKMIMPQHRFIQPQNLGSEDEDYEHLKSARRMAKNQARLRRSKTSGIQSDLDHIPNGDERNQVQGRVNGLQRSITVSPNSGYSSLSHRKRKPPTTLPNTGFLSLTYTQAQACKWIISGYVFSIVIAIIMGVVRSYVSIRALSSHEPFGWAIGYLFGNIQTLRFWIVSNNFETWISLPGHTLHKVGGDYVGWVERARQSQLGQANTRLGIAGYCLVVLIFGIGVVLQLGKVVEVDTRRKVFHGIMVAMLLPTVFVDPCFIALALGLILAIFLLLDLFRASQLPPVSKPLTIFLAPYVDGRDYRGPVIVSHIFLLVGCAIPLWLSLVGAPRAGEGPWVGWDTTARELSMISGIVCVGMGDAAASLIGRRYGKTKWFWGGGKSLEGSFAFAAAVAVGLAASYAWLRIGGWLVWDSRAIPGALFKMAVAGSGASILESVLTAGNDNVIVPIGLWLLTRGLHI